MSTSLLSVTQLAEELGVDRSTIHRRIDRGELTPAGYVGNRALFRREDVEALGRGEQTISQAAPETPEVGTLWRFKTSKKTYRVTATFPHEDDRFVALRALDTQANTSLSLDELRARCVFVGRLEGGQP